MIERIHWLGHSSFRIESDGVVVYFDPWKVASRAPSADLVLVSHGHYDHLSQEDIDRVRTSRTTVIMPQSCAATHGRSALGMKPGEVRTVGKLEVLAVPAYNPAKNFHPRKNGWLGYVVRFPSGSVYHAGDTDLIPEMETVRADIALLPVGGTYTMDAQEAALAAQRVGAKKAIPMHWGDLVGSRADAEQFKRLAAALGVEVRVLEPER